MDGYTATSLVPSEDEMSKWTPAPWKDNDGLVNGQESRERFAPGVSVDIFDASEWPVELHNEALANARLIAAAPELVAALEALVETTSAKRLRLDIAGPSDAQDDFYRARSVARVLLARITGEIK